MICALVLFALCSGSVALVFKKTSSSNRCGVVLGAFGSQNYVNIGTKVAKHIRALQVSKGWCTEQPELSSVPVAFFTDLKDHACPEGVECFGESDMAPWKSADNKIGGSNAHLGSWKYRWYHAQMMVNSPYDLTLYVDVDALPCSGEAIQSLFATFVTKDVVLGSIRHNTNPCAMTGGKCSAMPPVGIMAAEHGEWAKFQERNGGVILADMRKMKHIFEEWAMNIDKTAGKALGDQLGYRQALFMHRNKIKEHTFNESEVCRSLPFATHNCNKGCWISHKPGMKSLKAAGIIGGTAHFAEGEVEAEEDER